VRCLLEWAGVAPRGLRRFAAALFLLHPARPVVAYIAGRSESLSSICPRAPPSPRSYRKQSAIS
jgi:hypothetical protein